MTSDEVREPGNPTPTTAVAAATVLASAAMSSRPPELELLVVTWNIQFGVQAASAARALDTSPDLRGADVILLQEMDEPGARLIADRLDLDVVYSAASVHPQTGREFGNAVLSRRPLREPGVVELPHTSAIEGQPRIMVHAAIDVDGSHLRVGSVHTEVPSLSPPKRRRQFATIGAAAAGWDEPLRIVGGDFNTLTRRGIGAVTAALEPAGARRVTAGAGPTLRRSGRDFTLDHIYASGLAPAATGVVNGLDASDHCPLWVRLTAAVT